MKKKMSVKFLKKLTVGLLTLACILTGAFFVETKESQVQATESVDENDFIAEPVNDIASYRIEGSYTYPKPTTEGKENYIFAGWYTTADCSTAYTKTTLSQTVISSENPAYAKYVPAETLNVKFQATAGINEASEKSDLRMVSTVDSTAYTEVGFKVTSLSTGVTKQIKTDTVYKRIKSNTEGLEFGYSPVIFDTDSEYFVTVTIKNIKDFDKEYQARAYWVTLDGTEVEGTTRNARVSDSYNKIANIPVNLYTDNTVGQGTITVTGYSDNFTYVDYEEGSLFAEGMTVTENDTTITITLPENTAIEKPNDMLVNLRFTVGDGASSNNTFTIRGTNADESAISGVYNYTYNVYSTYYSGSADTSWYDSFEDETDYVIATADDLYGFASIINNTSNVEYFKSKTVYLGADITLNEGVVTEDRANGWSTDNPSQWEPIGYKVAAAKSFAGTFDGQGNTISGLYSKTSDVNNTHYYGLFGITNVGSVIQNFKMENSYFNRISTHSSSPQSLVASVAGQAMGDVRSVYSSATIVTGSPIAGGIVSRAQVSKEANSQTFEDCWFDGKIIATSASNLQMRIGGILGYGFNAGHTNISNCLNTGTIQCTFSIDAAKAASVGGVVGSIAQQTTYYMNISNCMSTGAVVVQETVDATLTNYATGVASIIGYNENLGHATSDEDSTKLSNVTVKNTIGTKDSHASGYKQASSGKWTSTGNSLGKLTNDDISTYENYDNVACLNIYSTNAVKTGVEDAAERKWVITENGTPELKSFCDEWIDIGWYKETESGEYTIYTPEELYALSVISQDDTFAEKTIYLGDDIKMNSGKANVWADSTSATYAGVRTFKPIGKANSTAATAFQGKFDGQGHEVSGIYIYETSGNANGFFGQISGSTISDFTLTNSCIIASTHNTGSVIGWTHGGSVSDIYSDASVITTGDAQSTGGIIGQIHAETFKCTVSGCWYDGEISSQVIYTGGIVGRVYTGTATTLEDCLFTGNIDSVYNTEGEVAYAGGIVGGIHPKKSTQVNCTIKNTLSNGALTAQLPHGVGSVTGRSVFNNAVEPVVVYENVYTATEISGATFSTANATTGMGSYSLHRASVTGEPLALTDADLQSDNAYVYTMLDFKENTDSNGAWITSENGPELYGLSSVVNTKNFDSVQKVATDWYCNEVKYTTSGSATQTTENFTVADAADMKGLAKLVNDEVESFEGYTVSVKDNVETIDLNPGWTAEINDDYSVKTVASNTWTPIGTDTDSSFNGTFDGNMTTIQGIYLTSQSGNAGLFGTVGSTGTVKDLKIANSYLANSGASEDVRNLGGVIAYLEGNAEKLYGDIDVYVIAKATKNSGGSPAQSYGATGGLIGTFNNDSTETTEHISECWFAGTAYSAKDFVGGILGHAYKGKLLFKDCLNTGSIISTCQGSKGTTYAYAGGLIGGARSFDGSYASNQVLSVELNGCLSQGAVNVTAIYGVGSVMGRSLQAIISNRNVYTLDNITNTEEEDISYRCSWTGYGDYSNSTAVMTGTALVKTSDNLQGVSAYEYTELDIYSEDNPTGVWIAIDGNMPELKCFTDKTEIESFNGTPRRATGWYYNNWASSYDKTNKTVSNTTTEYSMSTAADMYGLAQLVNDGTELFASKTITLTDNIVFNNVTTGTEAEGWADGENIPNVNWTPIGTSTNTFQGTFDGAGKTISGIYLTSTSSYQGLFGRISGATLRNFRLENSYFVTTNTTIGSIAGAAKGNSKIQDVYSNAMIHGTRQVGGFVGTAQRDTTEEVNDKSVSITGCWFDGGISVNVPSANKVAQTGGIVGYSYGGTTSIDTCLNTSDIVMSYTNTANQKTAGVQIGGIVGIDGTNGCAQIANCISEGSITGEWNGVVYTDTPSNVTQTNSIMGYVQNNNSSIANVYAMTEKSIDIIVDGETTSIAANTTTYNLKNGVTATVSADKTYADKESYLYGVNGYILLTNLTFDATHWAAVAGHLPVPAALTTEALDLEGVSVPDIAWYNGSAGTQDNPYQIANVAQLMGFAQLSQSNTFSGEFFELTNDITINAGDAEDWAEQAPAVSWDPFVIGANSSAARFTGTFDGNHHTISGLYMKQDATYLGLFAATDTTSTVKNLRLTNSYIEQTKASDTGYTGSIVSDCRGNIENIYSDAILVSPSRQTGGIIGRLNDTARTGITLKNCWYDGTITSSSTSATQIGGIVGTLVQGVGTLENCVFTGNIFSQYTGDSHVCLGGLCGYVMAQKDGTQSSMTLNNCIAAGNIRTQNADKGAGALVGLIQYLADATTQASLTMTNVFATHASGYTEVGAIGANTGDDGVTESATVTGEAVWTNNEDRLIGYCKEATIDGVYTGGSLDYAGDTWILREEGVPVPAVFSDMNHVTEIEDPDTILALTTMDSSWTLASAENVGLGHYVLRSTGKSDTEYNAYLTALAAQGFKEHSSSTDADGLRNAIYVNSTGEWIVNVVLASTGDVTVTISNGTPTSDTADTVLTASTDTAISLSMLRLTGSSAETGSVTYTFGNSFVFKLPNGHFVINDGGHQGDFEGLMTYLKDAAGISDDTTKIYVDAWVISHQHADHASVLAKIATEKAAREQLVVEKFFINEPNRKSFYVEYSAAQADVKGTAHNQYKGIRALRDSQGNIPEVCWFQTGETYTFDGLKMYVVQTQEQIPVSEYAKRNSYNNDGTDYNTASSSVVFETAGGQKAFLGGDMNYVNMKKIMDLYGSTSTVLSEIDVYQAPHHGKNTSMKINSSSTYDINEFTDYLLNLRSGNFKAALFPCSVFYGNDLSDSWVFPNAGTANTYLRDKSNKSYHYGNGTVTVTLDDTFAITETASTTE